MLTEFGTNHKTSFVNLLYYREVIIAKLKKPGLPVQSAQRKSDCEVFWLTLIDTNSVRFYSEDMWIQIRW